MPTNDTNINGLLPIGCDVAMEYELFDALPRELRDLLNYCPIKATALTLYWFNFWQGYQLRPDILEQWKREFRTAFPEYQPLPSDTFVVD